ncbi:MAG: insulinase family protein, partial [Prevotella sp.]|nr:insulinase family protein [Prevotella sp.]
MRIRNLFLSALLVVAAVASAQQMPPIPVDKQVRIGKLDCGLTYYIRHNNWPEDKANFYIAQRVGSIQEDDSQRGLAHFLEHMAFNGSEHFPDSTLLEFTRSLGVEFGSDLNAYTSIDETVYRITDVPTKRATALDSCLLILKDWSNGLTLADKEIDKERGVIHQEWQLNEGPMQRGYQRILPKLYPGSKYGHRMPIGLMEIVDNFPYQVLRDYYKKWYRPDNQAVIVVGNVDVDHIEAEIKRLWAGVTVPANAAKVVDEPVPDNAEAIYVIDKDKEQQFSRVTIAMKHDIVPDSDKVTVAYLIDQYAKELITMMFNQRLEEATQQANSPFAAAGSYDDNYMISKTKDAFTLIAYAKEGQDLETLAALYREAQRVRQHGFTPSEFQRAKDEYLSQLEKQYANRNKIKNSQFGDQYRDNYLSNEPIPSIEDEYQIMSQLAAAPIINVDIINGFAKELISDTDSNLVAFITLQEKEGKTYYSEADMAAAIKGVRGEKIEAYVDKTKNEPLIAKMPKAGKIVSKKDNATFGYTELTLS